MTGTVRDALGTLAEMDAPGGRLGYYSLERVPGASRLPFSIKILLESLLRNEDGFTVTGESVEALASYDPLAPGGIEIPFLPARVLLQDFTGVPCLVDLAAMRSALERTGGDPDRINPSIPVDLVIDHSVQVDAFGRPSALSVNAEMEFERNAERYAFIAWGQKAFSGLRVIPPGGGICHQVNLEFLARVVQTRTQAGRTLVFPDSLVGTDSHTPMVNGLGVAGWGVGGIEAEAVMLGRPLFMTAPAVVGVGLAGELPAGATATDLVLTVTQMLRARGVVGKFVEFFGQGLSSLAVTDRATIANMAPEYGATMGFFPVDGQTLAYLRATGRPADLVDLVERYTREQGLFRTDETPDPVFESTLEIDLGTVEPSMAGPSRPQDRVALGAVRESFRSTFDLSGAAGGELGHGSVVIAAITSCTNTSNPSVMLGAGILARNAVERSLAVKPWVKTSLAPGSRVVTEYLDRAGLTPYLEKLGFHTVGYGCTTCIGNSGPLPEEVSRVIEDDGLVVTAVLSGNRNFEGRIHQQVRASYLASPQLVVAHALAGTIHIDMTTEPLGTGSDGKPVMLADIWPGAEEIARAASSALDPETYGRLYGDIESTSEQWNGIDAPGGSSYAWRESTYIHEPPFFLHMEPDPGPITAIRDARVLVTLGDSITTDHISPAGAIARHSPAGRYLEEQGVGPAEFNTYGSRRGNDLVMTRGTFANIRLRNLLAPGTEGGWTTHLPTGEVTTIHEASRRYAAASTPLVVLAGRDYGMGSSRDWAAKGTLLLGVKVVIARGFERIHRSNLVGMGVLPLQFPDGESIESLGLTGRETFHVEIDDAVEPGAEISVQAVAVDGSVTTITTLCRLDSPVDVVYYRNGGILQTVLRDMM
ncbi:MAG: aconitate hydratase AcnA [Deltaproteobacteria bacterium]|nr:aconitate hydratase AcnA [Deltaproteobacteria bacterium]